MPVWPYSIITPVFRNIDLVCPPSFFSPLFSISRSFCRRAILLLAAPMVLNPKQRITSSAMNSSGSRAKESKVFCRRCTFIEASFILLSSCCRSNARPRLRRRSADTHIGCSQSVLPVASRSRRSRRFRNRTYRPPSCPPSDASR